jgi:hypothetical protein
MTITRSAKRPASRWHMVLAAAPALLFAACMADPSDPSPLAPGNEVGEKAGCTHIRFCSTPGFAEPHVITCDTNDQVCSSNTRFNECRSDAQAVCGRLTPMVFDPPIPCPISGVCSSGSLGSIGFP